MLREWEYNTLRLTEPISENKLKQMGADRWELTGCTTQAYPASDSGANVGRGAITKYIYYFKMPKGTAFP